MSKKGGLGQFEFADLRGGGLGKKEGVVFLRGVDTLIHTMFICFKITGASWALPLESTRGFATYTLPGGSGTENRLTYFFSQFL